MTTKPYKVKIMRKFVRKKNKGAASEAQSEFSPQMTAETSTNPHSESEIEKLKEKLKVLDRENSKLKDSAQKLLNENVDLKERINRTTNRPQPKRPPNEPSWQESKKLVEMVTQENDYLLSQIKTEHHHIRELKTVHLTEIDKISEDLDLSQMEKCSLEEKFKNLRVDYDRIQSQIGSLTQDFHDSIPIEDHQTALSECQSLLTELKETYRNELTSLYESTKTTHSEMRRIALEMAKIQAELVESRNRNEKLNSENHQIKEANVKLQAELLAAFDAKTEAETTLKQLLAVTETLTKEKNYLLEEREKLRGKFKEFQKRYANINK